MAIDLHTHSSASDGVDDPALLIARAAEAGVTTIALTDHDTLAGIEAASVAARRLGVRLIPGVELSVDHGGVKLHMLVYFTDPGTGPLEDRLALLREGRARRNVAIVERVQELGYSITMADVQRQAGGPSVGRPHIADALIAAGAFASRDDVFEQLLHDGGPAYVERDRLTAVEAMELARSIDAVPVIAHPKTISLDAGGFDELFEDLADKGLGGIEAHHPMHEPALRSHLVDVAHRLGLAATGGSDYHGAGKRPFSIGTGTGDLRVPIEAVDEIEQQRVKNR